MIQVSKNTIVIYGAKRSGNHLLQGYFKNKGEECEFRHEAKWAKRLYKEKGKQLIILVRNPRDQLISNMYSMHNAHKGGYDVGHVDRPLEEHEPQILVPEVVGAACKYLKEFTDGIVRLAGTYPYQFVLYDTIAKKDLDSNYTQRGPEYYKKAIVNYDYINEILDNSDIEEYCLKIWRAFNLQQTVFYPELAN